MTRLKIFETIRRYCATYWGISSSNMSAQRKCSFNIRLLFGFVLFGYLIPAQFLFVFRVANGFTQYMVSICSTSASVIMFVCYAAIISKRNLLFENIDQFEKLIDSSEPIFKFLIS